MRLGLPGDLTDARQTSADAAAVRLGAHRANLDPVVSEFRITAQQLGKAVDSVDHDIDVAVIVEISKCRATRSAWIRDPRASLKRYICEVAFPQVLIKQLALSIPRFRLELLYFWIDVTVANQNVGPAVVVKIKKSNAPAEELRVRAQSCRERCIFEICSALVVVKRRCVAGEVCFDDIEVPVHVIVGSRYAHARLGLTVGTQRASGFNGDVLKFPILLVLVQGACGGIIGNIDVRPSIVVEVAREYTQAVGAVCAENASRFRDIAERAVAIVVVENVLASQQSRRPTRDHHALVQTGTRLRNRRGGQIHIDVVGNEQIEFAVAIVVNESAAGVPALAIARDSGLLAYIGERPVTVIVIKNVLPEVGDKQIIPPVVVVIAHAASLAPAGMRDTGPQ